jgi:hypothetical protein
METAFVRLAVHDEARHRGRGVEHQQAPSDHGACHIDPRRLSCGNEASGVGFGCHNDHDLIGPEGIGHITADRIDQRIVAVIEGNNVIPRPVSGLISDG